MKAVYRFSKYDISQDKSVISSRYATKEAIAKVGGVAIEDSMIMVDENLLGDEEEGFTVKNFKA